jgi:hypothetical protein
VQPPIEECFTLLGEAGSDIVERLVISLDALRVGARRGAV